MGIQIDESKRAISFKTEAKPHWKIFRSGRNDSHKMENSSVNTLQLSTCTMTSEAVRDFLPKWIMYFVIFINVIFCITAALGNTLVLDALQEYCRLRSPSKLLFRSLASTDLCVGLIHSLVLLSIYFR